MVRLPEDEAWARKCLHAALPGCAVDQHDDNSEAGMYDLTITYPDGAIEVTAAADRQQLELWKLVGGRGKRWIEPGLAGGPRMAAALRPAMSVAGVSPGHYVPPFPARAPSDRNGA